MKESITFELVSSDNAVADPDDLDYFPLGAVSTEQLEWAHRIAGLLLRYKDDGNSQHQYTDGRGNTMELPESTAAYAHSTLRIDRIDPGTVAAVSEIAHSLRCKLVPQDGGPDVLADAAEILSDLSRRALEKLRPDGVSLVERKGGAKRLARMKAVPDAW